MADDDVSRLAKVVGELADVVDRLPIPNNSQATITVQAGGVGVWASAAAAVFMLGLSIGLTALVIIIHNKQTDLAEDQRVTKAYIQSIWQQVPSLKPKESDK